MDRRVLQNAVDAANYRIDEISVFMEEFLRQLYEVKHMASEIDDHVCLPKCELNRIWAKKYFHNWDRKIHAMPVLGDGMNNPQYDKDEILKSAFESTQEDIAADLDLLEKFYFEYKMNKLDIQEVERVRESLFLATKLIQAIHVTGSDCIILGPKE